MTFWGGSGSGSADPCLWLMDPDPDSDLDPGSGSCYFRHWPSGSQQKTNFLTKFFLLITFWSYSLYLHHFSKIKSQKESQNSRNQGFSYYFCMMIKGSGSGSRAGSESGSIPLTSGSGSGRPKNMWIRWIRIRNTAFDEGPLKSDKKNKPRLQLVSYGSNELYLDSQFKWSANTFNEWHWYFRCNDSGGKGGTNTAVSNNNRKINNNLKKEDSCNNHNKKNYEKGKGLRRKVQQSREPALKITNYYKIKILPDSI
jgi:hypothetical protein